MRYGTAYGVGVGPGEPELLTLKAVRLIRESDVIALPGKNPTETVAYKIAAAAVPELADKELVPLDLPMVRDKERLDRARREQARVLEGYLSRGKNVVCLTLGDPTIYSTFSPIQRILEADGFPTAMIPGVPSFCAAAARLNTPLAEWDEPLHIIPAVHRPDEMFDQPGNYVLMKPAGQIPALRDALRASGRQVMMVENCGMANERICLDADAIPDDAGYFSLIIAK